MPTQLLGYFYCDLGLSRVYPWGATVQVSIQVKLIPESLFLNSLTQTFSIVFDNYNDNHQFSFSHINIILICILGPIFFALSGTTACIYDLCVSCPPFSALRIIGKEHWYCWYRSSIDLKFASPRRIIGSRTIPVFFCYFARAYSSGQVSERWRHEFHRNARLAASARRRLWRKQPVI